MVSIQFFLDFFFEKGLHVRYRFKECIMQDQPLNPQSENEGKDQSSGSARGKKSSSDGFSGLASAFGGLLSGLQKMESSAGTSASGKGHQNVTGKSIQHWDKLTNVKELHLEYCRNLTDKDLKPLASLINLEILNLSGSGITGDCFKYTKNFESVKELILIDCPNLTDKGLGHLNHLPNLEVLKISGCQITGSCMKNWKELSRLRELALCNCPKLVDKNLRYLGDITTLETINISGIVTSF